MSSGEISAFVDAAKKEHKIKNRLLYIVVGVTLATNGTVSEALSDMLNEEHLLDLFPGFVSDILDITPEGRFLILTFLLLASVFKFFQSHAHLEFAVNALTYGEITKKLSYPWVALEKVLGWRFLNFFGFVLVPSFGGISIWFYTPGALYHLRWSAILFTLLFFVAGLLYNKKIILLRSYANQWHGPNHPFFGENTSNFSSSFNYSQYERNDSAT